MTFATSTRSCLSRALLANKYVLLCKGEQTLCGLHAGRSDAAASLRPCVTARGFGFVVTCVGSTHIVVGGLRVWYRQ